MDYGIAVLDIEVELVQRFCAGGDEILLDVHRDVWALKLASQRVTIAPKFFADGREEQLHRWHGTIRLSDHVVCLYHVGRMLDQKMHDLAATAGARPLAR